MILQCPILIVQRKFEKLGISLTEQKRLANVAVDDGDADYGEDYQGEDEEPSEW